MKNKQINIKLTETEVESLKSLSEESNWSMSEWIRHQITLGSMEQKGFLKLLLLTDYEALFLKGLLLNRVVVFENLKEPSEQVLENKDIISKIIDKL